MGTNYENPLFLNYFFLFLIFNSVTLLLQVASNNTITQGQLVKDGQIIISEGQNFALGFFSSENSTSRYVGIWYYKIPVQTVIWVANRDKPISGESGFLSIGNGGNLMVSDGNITIWSTNISSASTNLTAVLMDSGNLILLQSENLDDPSKSLWESFRDPTDTYLPDMRIHTNVLTGKGTVFSSWKSEDDPSYGNYSLRLDTRASPQMVVWDGLNRRHWRSGHWNGLIFTGLPGMTAQYLYGFKLINEGNGNVYFTYTMVNSSIITRFRLGWDGTVNQYIWDEGQKRWNIMLSEPSNAIEFYNTCGNFGIGSAIDPPLCYCMEGFSPKYVNQWNRGYWSDGCVRRDSLQCDVNGTKDGVLEIEGLKLPDFADTFGAPNISKCREECLKNCSCSAYTFVPGIGCMRWGGDLVDMEHFKGGGNILYVRVAHSELGGKSKISNVVIITTAVVVAIVIGMTIWILWRCREKLLAPKNTKMAIADVSSSSQGFPTAFMEADDLAIDGKQGNGPQLPVFSFSVIQLATDKFANKNKLGEGGFGPVYKGTLPRGEEVAVKRLSKWSGQGLGEFKTELILIAKLQHRNLVRLLGCCIEGEEKLLIYEYMRNKSLDSFLFDPLKKAQLDWKMRFAIIEGIARGLLYLHRDSRLRIIHRDLKASNILLDEDMNPKISDFGMARIFGGNQNEANTVRVVGTYGYMSPEYAMEGLFSVKSDVYSFGVLLLEIVNGQRNSSFHSPDCSNLIRYASNLWKDNKAMELIDPSIADSCSQDEVMRCIHVAMLCIQSSAAHRPTMSNVMMMLEGGTSNFSMPKLLKMSSLSSTSMELVLDHQYSSSIEVQITEVVGR